MDFNLPEHLPALLAEMDAFIEAEIKPLERENIQYFDHRREHARTDWDNGGVPRREWEDLLDEMRRRADAAGCCPQGEATRHGAPSEARGVQAPGDPGPSVGLPIPARQRWWHFFRR